MQVDTETDLWAGQGHEFPMGLATWLVGWYWTFMSLALKWRKVATTVSQSEKCKLSTKKSSSRVDFFCGKCM